MIDDAIVLDGHMDTPLRMVDEGIDLGAGSDLVHADLPRLRAAGVDAVFLAAWIDPAFAPDGALSRCERLLRAIRDAAASRPDRAGFATTAREVREIAASGRVALLAGVENGQALEGRIGNLDRLHALGARYLTLTWMNSNEWGDAGGGEALHGGLSSAGRELVDALNRRAMIVDLAHAAPSTLRDALDRSSDPVIVSHTATEARGTHPRNLGDEQIRAVGETGGVVGIAFMPAYLSPGDPDSATLETIVDHVERIVEVAGVEAAALGSDFDGVPSLPGGVRGVEDYPAVAGELARRGFDAEERAAILGGNWLRVIERVVDGKASDGTFG